MNNMMTTNVRIPRDELLTYREYALNQGKSFSQLVREVLAKAVQPAASIIDKRKKTKKRSFWDIGKYAIRGGDPKASQNIDKYVYNL